MDQAEVSPLSRPALKVSVIIPVYYGGAKFRLCLAALANATPPPEEIIVVADGHTDGAWLIAEEFGAKGLHIPVSGGPARARNLGAETAQGEILFFVDADVVVPPDIIRSVENAFHNEPGMAALIGSYDDEPGETNFLSQYKNLFHHYVHQCSRAEASTFWGACGAIRRDIFLATGGFDEGYRRSSIEDIAFGYRLRQAGYKIRLVKEIQVKHLKHWGIVSLLKSDFLDRALPWTELILRYRSFINDLNLSLANRISVMLIYGMVITTVSAVWRVKALALTGAFTLLLIAINVPVYRFFLRKRGFWFTMKVIPWHWLYYLYSGLAFAAGIGRHLLFRQKGPQPDL
jgi:GT2 family glycosyltransferase